jgi:hypothetical protein
MFLPFEVNCQIVLESVTILNNACHIFILKNMFLHVTNILHCVIMLTFLLKMWMFIHAPYWFKGAPWVGQLLTEYRVIKLGSVFKMCRWEGFAHYLAVRGNIIVYATFCWNHLSLFLHLQHKDFKKMFKCAPLSFVLRMIKIGLLGVYMYKVVNNNCTHDLSNSLRVINHHIQFHCSTCTTELVSLSLVQTKGHSHNCLHELVMAMLLFKVSVSQSSQHT